MSDGGKSSLPYERPGSGGISRWQFRLLLALVLVNVGLTLQMTLAPGAGSAVREWWANYRENRRTAALVRQAKAFVEPPTKVVWDEDPESSAALLELPGYRRMVFNGHDPALVNLPTGARAVPPEIGGQVNKLLQSAAPNQVPQQAAVLLLHSRTTAGGEERLILVKIHGNYWTTDVARHGESQRAERSGAVRKILGIVAFAFVFPADSASPRLDPAATAALHLNDQRPATDVRFDYRPPTEGRPEQFELQNGQWCRFYAGQPDPADPSKFTIDYEVQGVRGMIHGRLRENGTLEMKPTTGVLAGDGWYLRDEPPGVREPARNGAVQTAR